MSSMRPKRCTRQLSDSGPAAAPGSQGCRLAEAGTAFETWQSKGGAVTPACC